MKRIEKLNLSHVKILAIMFKTKMSNIVRDVDSFRRVAYLMSDSMIFDVLVQDFFLNIMGHSNARYIEVHHIKEVVEWIMALKDEGDSREFNRDWKELKSEQRGHYQGKILLDVRPYLITECEYMFEFIDY